MWSRHGQRRLIYAMCAGIGCTLFALIATYLARGALADHISDGYPAYEHERVQSAVATYLAIGTVVGTLGIVAWTVVIWAVRKARAWAAIAATVAFMSGVGVSLYGLIVKDTSGDTALPAVVGWVWVLPCVPGSLVVGLLWSEMVRAREARLHHRD